MIASERTKKHSLPRSTNRLQIQDLDKALSLIPGKYRLPIKQPNPVEILQLMLLVREGDRRESSLMRQGKGYIHISGMGHEPLAVLNYYLRREDYLFTYYRDRSLMIARGMTPQRFANDYFASAKSSTGGRGMPVHSSSKSLNIFPPATPTGSQCLPAVGAAWGIKMANQDGVVICTIGDASVRQGEFYEAVCFDDLYVKVRLREAARERRIPVLMETSDRGLLDIERFDMEPDRPLFHGVAGSINAADLRGLSTNKKLPLVLKILDMNQVSTSMKASMLEIEETLETWPQLGSAVTLGGAVMTDTARRILLGHLQGSGRFYIDLETLVHRQCAVPLSEPVAKTVTAAESSYPISPYPRPACRNANGVSTDEIRFIVFHGSLAPSGGNVQPWRFEWRKGQLDAIHLPDRSCTLLDFNNCASYVAFGAVAENIDLAARELGLRHHTDRQPVPAPRSVEPAHSGSHAAIPIPLCRKSAHG